ncbi:fasciclin domain-containing protein [Chitinophaga flava]|nr:fasciclin domain-containing protein [Chitinophaga flava]
MRYYTLPCLFFFLLLMMAGCRKDNLTPPRETAPTRSLGEFIRNNYDLSLLSAAMQKAGILDSLNQPGPFTCFAPDNKAFNDIGITSPRDFDTIDAESLRRWVKYHVLKDRKYISEFPLQMGNKYTTLAGADLYVSSSDAPYMDKTPTESRSVFVNGSMIFPAPKRNLALANGVIHVIRKPLNYTPGTVQDYLQADTSLSIFVAAMKRFALWDGLKEKGPFTVYVPGNEAFRKNGFTADSISRMDPEKFQQIIFAIYPLMLKSKHIFSTDWGQINGQSGAVNTMISVPGFVILPFYSYNFYNNTEDVRIDIMMEKGGYNANGPQRLNYRNGFANGADRVVSNGILHILDDLMLYPHTLRK